MIIIITSIFEYFNDKSWLSGPLQSMVIFILLKIGTLIVFTKIHMVLIVEKQLFQIKILNDFSFFLIIIYRLIQFKVFILPEKFYGPATFRMHCDWSIDHCMALQFEFFTIRQYLHRCKCELM